MKNLITLFLLLFLAAGIKCAGKISGKDFESYTRTV